MKRIVLTVLLLFGVLFELHAANFSMNSLSKQLCYASGKKVDTATALANKKYIALYFSASWCGPCRSFTPKLVDFYKKVGKKQRLEVILVNSDKTADAMTQYMKSSKMKWLAIPFDDPARKAVKTSFKVRGVPTLIILDNKGKVVSADARWDVTLLGAKAVDAWKKPGYKPLTYDDSKKGSSSDDSKKAAKTKRSKSKKKSSKKSK